MHHRYPNPDFTASLNLSLRWKNLDLSVFLYGVYGNDVLYNNYTFSPRVKAKRWTPDNPTNDFPRLNNARQYWLSDYFLQTARSCASRTSPSATTSTSTAGSSRACASTPT